jgi:death on curing protein
LAEVGATLKYPTRLDLVDINRRHIRESGGFSVNRENLRNPASLEWVLDSIQHSELFGIDQYPTPEEKAALLAWVIIEGHVFHDGSKRTAMSVMDAFLRDNGYILEATNDEIVQIAIEIARGQEQRSLTRDDFVRWTRDRIRERSL